MKKPGVKSKPYSTTFLFILFVIILFTIAIAVNVNFSKEYLRKITTPETASAEPDESGKSSKKKIAYAITVTKDGNFVDGALVLGYSAKKVHDETKGVVMYIYTCILIYKHI